MSPLRLAQVTIVHLVLLSTGLAQSTLPLSSEPPTNPYLADSPWPMSHRNPYNQASSPHAGPTSSTQAVPAFLSGGPVPITLAVSAAYPQGRRAVWGTTVEEVVKVDVSGPTLRYIDRIPRKQRRDEAISGAYSILDCEGTYFVPRGFSIEAFCDVQPQVFESSIEKSAVYSIPESLRKEGDAIVGLSLTYDGCLAFVTRRGLVGCVRRDFSSAAYLQVPAEDNEMLEVSNSLAIDETGGLFVTTDRCMVRVQWTQNDVEHGEDAGTLKLAWSVSYQTSGERAAGRLGKGSGTTPTLMGWGNQDQFVVIGDGQKLMHLVLFWRGGIPADWKGLPGRDRRVAAEVPVCFGDADATSSTTEQSLTIRGNAIVTVSNKYGPLSPFMRRFARRRMGNNIHHMTIYRSNRPEVAPYGVEKFSWDSDRRELRSVWANPAISCPNGIPTMSEATGLMYCIGQREGQWTLEGIDWESGESVFFRRLQRHTDNNSFYAATELIGGGSVMTGTFGGMLQFANTESTTTLAFGG